MRIRSKMISSMAIVIIIFGVAIFLNIKNSKDLQLLSKTSITSYALSTAFLNIYNSSLQFRINKQSITLHLKSFVDTRAEFEAVLAEFNTSEGKELLDKEFRDRWDNINKLWDFTENSLDLVIKALDEMKDNEIQFLFNTKSFSGIIADTSVFSENDNYRKDYTNIRNISKALASIETTTDVLAKALSNTRDALSAEVEKETSSNLIITYVSSVFATILALMLSLIFSNSISKKIGQIKTILQEISNKNLAVKIDINSKDEFNELGEYVKNLVLSLQEFIKTAGESVDQVRETEEQISTGTNSSADSLNNISDSIVEITSRFSTLDQNIEQSTLDITSMDTEIVNIVNNISDQSDAVSNSSSAIEEMTASVNQIARLTSKKQESTSDLLKVVVNGGITVENTFENMQLVNDELDQVKDLVDVIKNVADQTNILSMNAAIESAHAGDAGKGFSVVADEIRSLAEYTSNNVQAINSAITSISTRIGASLKASEESSIVFEKINKDVHDFSLAMAEIASSIEELAAGGVEVLDSTNRVSTLNHEVYQGAGRIKEQSGMIENSMLSIKTISGDVNSNIQGISKGTNTVLESFSGIDEISSESGIQIGDLANKINEYKLKD